ncbi:hypothetical protein B0H13DRAFT_2398843 [Mycena leptocephala]|nr:hypothetical protein B0H13DRAFT_2398843 [Mycena leptocephala]
MICEALTQEPSAELSPHICAFPPELLARVLKFLAYFDILRASVVCKLWNGVIRGDPEIAQLLYKTICRSITDDSEFSELDEFDDSGDPVVIHPALQIISYSMGGNIQTAAIYHRSPAPGERLHKYKFSVIDLGIAHDFATRPTVTQVFVKPKVDFGGRTGVSGAFCAKATNARGVTVLDVLQALVRDLDTTKHQQRDRRHGRPSVAGSLYTGWKEKGKVAQQSGLPRRIQRSTGAMRELTFWLAKVACARAKWLVSGVGVDFGGITRPRPAFRLASHFVGLASHSASLPSAKWLVFAVPYLEP